MSMSLTLINEAVDTLDDIFAFVFFIVILLISQVLLARSALLSDGFFIGDAEEHIALEVMPQLLAVTKVGGLLLVLLSSTED